MRFEIGLLNMQEYFVIITSSSDDRNVLPTNFTGWFVFFFFTYYNQNTINGFFHEFSGILLKKNISANTQLLNKFLFPPPLYRKSCYNLAGHWK